MAKIINKFNITQTQEKKKIRHCLFIQKYLQKKNLKRYTIQNLSTIGIFIRW
jgi:hypothetical protein